MAPDPGIASVSIVTRDRLPELDRCLTGLITQLRDHSREPAIRVFDDASAEEGSERCRSLVGAIASRTGTPIGYVGPEEKQQLADDLVEHGVPDQVVEFALFGSRVSPRRLGANRNAALLMTTGDLTLQVDDDQEWCVAAAPHARAGVRYSTAYDPSEYRFFPDRLSTLASLDFADADILGLHERMLGRPVRVNERVNECGGHVLATLMGIAGDCGMDTPRWIWLTGPSRDRLIATEAAYRSAFRSREVLKVADCETVSAGRFCMAPCIGLDNRNLLPPFFPCGRNSDGIFGTTLRSCAPDGYFGHLPWAMLHTPATPREFQRDVMHVSWAAPEVPGLLGVCIRSLAARCRPDATKAERLMHLGGELQTLAALDLDGFDEYLHQRLADGIGASRVEIERVRETTTGPAYWTDDLDRFARSLDAGLSAPPPILPRNFLDGCEPMTVRRALRELFHQFGMLLEWWPAMMRVRGAA